MKKLFIFICCILLAWFIVSWGEVAANNINPSHEYSPVNYFTVFI